MVFPLHYPFKKLYNMLADIRLPFCPLCLKAFVTASGLMGIRISLGIAIVGLEMGFGKWESELGSPRGKKSWNLFPDGFSPTPKKLKGLLVALHYILRPTPKGFSLFAVWGKNPNFWAGNLTQKRFLKGPKGEVKVELGRKLFPALF
ncbi:hypothetical protein OUZ56_017662 [Daphnia magna]|uniref:Uncharacterized protein n=1 Tax=Daphnia magna TaxID=35525 RepID=A0ABR0ATE1_9CRUS|nr:hypothetical protein OUZ56_017662 [Daphnia magna]